MSFFSFGEGITRYLVGTDTMFIGQNIIITICNACAGYLFWGVIAPKFVIQWLDLIISQSRAAYGVGIILGLLIINFAGKSKKINLN